LIKVWRRKYAGVAISTYESRRPEPALPIPGDTWFKAYDTHDKDNFI